MKQNTVKVRKFIGNGYNKESGRFEEVFEDVEYKVGDGVTILYYSDKKPGTIIDISSDGRKVTVQEDSYTRIDDNGMSDDQEYTYERNPKGSIHTFTKNRRGQYTDNGKVDYGTVLGFGWRERYYDYSF